MGWRRADAGRHGGCGCACAAGSCRARRQRGAVALARRHTRHGGALGCWLPAFPALRTRRSQGAPRRTPHVTAAASTRPVPLSIRAVKPLNL